MLAHDLAKLLLDSPNLEVYDIDANPVNGIKVNSIMTDLTHSDYKEFEGNTKDLKKWYKKQPKRTVIRLH